MAEEARNDELDAESERVSVDPPNKVEPSVVRPKMEPWRIYFLNSFRSFVKKHRIFATISGVVVICLLYVGFAYAIKPWTTDYPPDMAPGRFERIYRDVLAGKRIVPVVDGLESAFGWKSLPENGVLYYDELIQRDNPFRRSQFIVGNYALGVPEADLTEENFRKFVKYVERQGFIVESDFFVESSNEQLGCKKASVSFYQGVRRSFLFTVIFTETKNPNELCLRHIEDIKSAKLTGINSSSEVMFSKTPQDEIKIGEVKGVVITVDPAIGAFKSIGLSEIKDTLMLWW